jgi:hypothetical protein
MVMHDDECTECASAKCNVVCDISIAVGQPGYVAKLEQREEYLGVTLANWFVLD